MTFTTYILASFPEVTLKLRTEIDSILGDRERITTNDIQRMPYCTRVPVVHALDSIIVLYSTIGVERGSSAIPPRTIQHSSQYAPNFECIVISHTTWIFLVGLRDSNLPSPLSSAGPFPIKKGVSVTYVPLIIQRQRDLWGEDAESFDPGRWLVDSSRPAFLHAFAFHPFHGGPRLVIIASSRMILEENWNCCSVWDNNMLTLNARMLSFDY